MAPNINSTTPPPPPTVAIPSSIHCFCLCNSITFTISFSSTSPSTAFPPVNNATCQCNNCRRFTGSLVPQSFQVLSSQISPPLSTFPTFKTYHSGAVMGQDSRRGFCGTCGSSLTHHDEEGRTEVWLGCVDVDVLAGTLERVEYGDAGETVAEEGKGSGAGGGGACESRERRVGGWGRELTRADKGHFWLRNAIPGVTDEMEGRKYWGNEEDGEMEQG